MNIVKKGFKDREVKDAEKYVARLKKEIAVLKMGDVIDYFLSLHDIIRYAKSKKMLTGIGRGSAGGSLVAYLMGIIQVDPLRFDLLFERFLNSGRMGKFEERPSYIIEADGETLEFEEGSLVRIKRDSKETVVFVHEVVEGDEIIRY
jgi:DNA polymerase-3 subunit alpha